MAEEEEITEEQKLIRITKLEEKFENHHLSLFKNKEALDAAIAKCSVYYHENKKK